MEHLPVETSQVITSGISLDFHRSKIEGMNHSLREEGTKLPNNQSEGSICQKLRPHCDIIDYSFYSLQISDIDLRNSIFGPLILIFFFQIKFIFSRKLYFFTKTLFFFFYVLLYSEVVLFPHPISDEGRSPLTRIVTKFPNVYFPKVYFSKNPFSNPTYFHYPFFMPIK